MREGLRRVSFFSLFFFLVRNPYCKAWRGRSDDGFVEGSVYLDTCILDVKKKKAREKEKKRKIVPALHGLIRWCSISSKKKKREKKIRHALYGHT